ncbi:MAG: hypothetical protein HYR84_11475 [Planctomycetes bacterium]|nr:hypothetical protein [Planctomycetota bacterium]
MSEDPNENRLSLVGDASLLACELEACVIAYIHDWELRAKSFANQFAETRLPTALGASASLASSTDMREAMNFVIGQFIEELHSSVTTLEQDALLNKITLLLLKNKIPEWSEDDKGELKTILSTQQIGLHEDESSWWKPIVIGAAAGAAYGAPFAGIGAVPGALFGAMAGLFISERYNSATLVSDTKAKLLLFVDHAVGLLNARKDLALDRALVFSKLKADASKDPTQP